MGQEDHLEKETATHSSILVWRIPWIEGAQEATVHGLAKESDMTQQETTETMLYIRMEKPEEYATYWHQVDSEMSINRIS